MGGAASCTGKLVDIVSEDEIQAAIKSIQNWEDTQRAGQRATQALRTVRKDSFKKAANELNQKGGIVERLGGPDRVHDVIQVFYRKLFQNAEVRQFFENLPSDRMRAKQMKFMRYIMGGPGTYGGNLRCKHVQMVSERGLDLAKFQVVVGLLLDTLKELNVPQDVIDDIVANTEVAKAAIFTPNADELVTAEEVVAAATELQNPLITRLGGPQGVQLITQAFYKKLFSSEELKYFFVSMSVERLRNMQFKFMRYLFCGPASYALTGGNMRCIHARMVKENGLDLEKFNMVVDMLLDVLNDLMVAKKNVREILNNVEAARDAIFTPGPDELVTKEEMVAEASGLESDMVDRLGGPEAVYDLISRFYAKLFNDPQLKYFFLLSADRLRTKQFRFMRYLIGGPPAYAALGGNLRCKHLPLIRDKGLDPELFDRAVVMLQDVLADTQGLMPDVETEILKNVAEAKAAIFTPGPEELISREELTAAADALNSDLVAKMGGSGHVYNVVSSFYAKVFNDPELKYFFTSLSEGKLRGKQFKLMVYLFGGPLAYATASPGSSLRCVHAKMVKESGLNVEKFDRVAKIMLETLKEEDASEEVITGVLKNVDSARDAIFTPGPDELVTKEEMVAEVASLEVGLVGRLGGPEAVYNLISKFYALLFHDPQLKYFFTLSAERLRSKQFKFMRYLVGGPGTYSGDLRCVHAGMVAERGLDGAKFDLAVGHLSTVMREMSVPEEVVAEVMANVEVAREAILRGAPGGAAAAGAAVGGGEAAVPDLYTGLGGDEGVGRLVDAFHSRLKGDPALSHIYAGVDMAAQRRRQLAFLRATWRGGEGSSGGGGGSRPGTSGGGGGGGGMSLGIAHAHLARDRSLTADHFEAIAAAWMACLTAQGAPADAIAEVLASLVHGKSLIYPPGPAAACPFASSFGMDDESALDAIIASAAAAAEAEAAAAAASSKPPTPPAAAGATAVTGGRMSRQGSSSAAGAGSAANAAVVTAGRMSRQGSAAAGTGVATAVALISREGSGGAATSVIAAAADGKLSRQGSSTATGAATTASAGRTSRPSTAAATAAAAAVAASTTNGSLARTASAAQRPASGSASAATARPPSSSAAPPPPRTASQRSAVGGGGGGLGGSSMSRLGSGASQIRPSLGLGVLAAEEEALMDTLMEAPPAGAASATTAVRA